MIDYKEREKNRAAMKDRQDTAVVNGFFCLVGLIISLFISNLLAFICGVLLIYYALKAFANIPLADVPDNYVFPDEKPKERPVIHQSSCYSCKGNGRCSHCRGTGLFNYQTRQDPHMYGSCQFCNGTGACSSCGGTGR